MTGLNSWVSHDVDLYNKKILLGIEGFNSGSPSTRFRCGGSPEWYEAESDTIREVWHMNFPPIPLSDTTVTVYQRGEGFTYKITAIPRQK